MNQIVKVMRRFYALVLSAAILLAPVNCFAGGILHVFPPTYKNETFAVARPTVLLSRALVTVSESYIEYRIDQTFFNNNDFPLSAIYLLPVDATAESGLEVKVDGVDVPYKVESPESFFPTLKKLTTSMKDPSLLGLAGKRLLVVRCVKIGIRRQESFRVQYKVPLRLKNNQLDLVLPLAGERYSVGPVGELDIQVRFKMSRPVRNVLSPSYHIVVTRESAYRCIVAARMEHKRIHEDFRLITTFSTDDLDLRVVVHRGQGEKGAFLAIISPPVVSRKVEEPDKDVVFLLDSSGSMKNKWLGFAKRAVVFGLERLGPRDRFNVVNIGTRCRWLAEQMLRATPENVMEASRFVNSAAATGGTDLYNGLIDSLAQFTTRKRLRVIILASDGRGTVGIVKPEAIAKDFSKYNRHRAKLFVLALGNRADMALLDKLATNNHGTCYHYSGTKKFPSAMNRFFSIVSPPQISDISLEFQDISPEELDADPIPDLFGQESLTIFGRYSGTKDTSSVVKLKGKVRGRQETINRTVVFPRVEPQNSYIPALWAMRRIASLLERDRLKGPEPEARDEIVALAHKFGFRLPFPEAAAASDLFRSAFSEDGSRLLWKFKTSDVVSDVASDHFRRVQEKTFHLEQTKWVDAQYRGAMPLRTVEFLSDNYFRLLKEDPGLGPYFALGPEVIVVHGSVPVQVTVHTKK
jgi:Ca-activated chloride channel homolog